MSRELSPQQAFQVQCLAQMGVSAWLDAPQGVAGTVFFAAQPWPLAVASDALQTPVATALSGFSEAAAKPVQKLAPEEKDQTVASLREQLNAGPEIVVEDLQPIEELAVDIDVEPVPEEAPQIRISHLDIRAYLLADKLLILTDVPSAFHDDEEIERLALKMGRALLQEAADEWQSRRFSWPGALTNPHFVKRQDWMLGAIESFLEQLLLPITGTPKVVLAGSRLSELLTQEGAGALLAPCAVANIASLPELYRIPELRKEAWQQMQQSLFAKPVSA